MARTWNHKLYWPRTNLSQTYRNSNIDSSDSISLRHLIRASGFTWISSMSILPDSKILCHKTYNYWGCHSDGNGYVFRCLVWLFCPTFAFVPFQLLSEHATVKWWDPFHGPLLVLLVPAHPQTTCYSSLLLSRPPLSHFSTLSFSVELVLACMWSIRDDQTLAEEWYW